MDASLIFDVGMHKCEDTDYYLNQGYCVVAVDADPGLIGRAYEAHAKSVTEGRLKLVNCAVDTKNGEIEFYLSEQSVWNSLKREIADRNNQYQSTIRVPARRLSDLFREYGVPFYCKIDVEGYDTACLETLKEAEELPRYISVETECLSEGEPFTDVRALETLEQLYGLGYRRFKLVDQRSLLVLAPSVPVYRVRPTIWERFGNRLGLAWYKHYGTLIDENRCRLNERHGYKFPMGSSGPFGDDLEGEWLDFGKARQTLLRHRQEFFGMLNVQDFDFWCDWHAMY